MLFALFCLLLFSPCIAAFLGNELKAAWHLDEFQSSKWKLPRWRQGKFAEPVVRTAEMPVAEGFVLRSFPKGLAQRRVMVQDIVEGVRLTIAQVRTKFLEAAKPVRSAYHSISETKSQGLKRLAEEARIAITRQVVRESRSARAAGVEYAKACSRLRWSERTADERQELVAA